MNQGPYMILGLTGRAGAGKDTAGDVLCSALNFHRMAFADALRREIVEAWGIDPGLFDVSTKERQTDALAIGRCGDRDFIRLLVAAGYSATAPRSPRQIMRWWGTEYRRAQNPVYWLDRAAETLNSSLRRGYRRVVITDVRFVNEADLIRHYNGQVWRIQRGAVDQAAAEHVSESQMMLIHADADIQNEGSLLALADSVIEAFNGVTTSTTS